MIDDRAFQRFLDAHAPNFGTISGATRGEWTPEDVRQQAWLLAVDLGDRRERPLDFDDADDASLLVRSLYNHCVNTPNIVVQDETGRILHEPPDASELPRRLDALCEFANQGEGADTFLHPVVRAILIHFMIGYDHPFVDGNGRTARALFYWSMLNAGFWMTEYLSISSILRKAQGQYARAYLLSESDDSDATYFVSHQLDVLIKAIEGVHGYIARKQQAHHDAETLLKPGSRLARRLNHRQRALLLNALEHPDKTFTIAVHRRTHATAYATARADLQGLVEAGLMKQSRLGKELVFHAVPGMGEKLRR